MFASGAKIVVAMAACLSSPLAGHRSVHTAVMARVRARIKDKRVCALVKAFLKSGCHDGVRRSGADKHRNPPGRVMRSCA